MPRKSPAPKGVNIPAVIIRAGKELEQLNRCNGAVDTLRRAELIDADRSEVLYQDIARLIGDLVDHLKQILEVRDAY